MNPMILPDKTNCVGFNNNKKRIVFTTIIGGKEDFNRCDTKTKLCAIDSKQTVRKGTWSRKEKVHKPIITTNPLHKDRISDLRHAPWIATGGLVGSLPRRASFPFAESAASLGPLPAGRCCRNRRVL